MTAYEFLTTAHRLKQKIKAKQLRLDRLYDLSSSISTSCFEERYSATRNIEPPFVRHLDKILELEHEIKDDKEKIKRFEADINGVISTLPNPQERLILRSVYLCGLSIEQTAKLLGHSVRNVAFLRKKAVRSFEKAYEELLCKEAVCKEAVCKEAICKEAVCKEFLCEDLLNNSSEERRVMTNERKYCN